MKSPKKKGAAGGDATETTTTKHKENTVTDDVKDKGELSAGAESALEKSLAAAGCDVGAAKANLKKLKTSFPGTSRKNEDGSVTVLTVGSVPEGALNRWIDENFSPVAVRSLLVTLAREWEQE